MRLTVNQRRKLHVLLLDAYPSAASFAMVLTLMGKNIEDITTGGTRPEKYLQVIVQAEAGNFIEALISAVFDHQEGNQRARDAIADLAAHIQQDVADSPSPLTPNTLFEHAFTDEADEKLQNALQRTVRRGQPDEEVRVFFERIEQVNQAVCSVEWSHEHQGTGFLIGTRTLITNQHVVAAMVGQSVTELSARFGFARGEGAIIHDGKRTGFADDRDWLAFSRDPDQTDRVDGLVELPHADNLDYAIVYLKQAPEGVVPVALDDIGTFASGNDIVLIQHPAGAPKKIAFGRVTEISGEGRRLRYDANTKSGSSGSPVMNHTGRLIGLHHAGDPNFDRMAKFNQAIPLSLIVADINANAVEVI